MIEPAIRTVITESLIFDAALSYAILSGQALLSRLEGESRFRWGIKSWGSKAMVPKAP